MEFCPKTKVLPPDTTNILMALPEDLGILHLFLAGGNLFSSSYLGRNNKCVLLIYREQVQSLRTVNLEEQKDTERYIHKTFRDMLKLFHFCCHFPCQA